MKAKVLRSRTLLMPSLPQLLGPQKLKEPTQVPEYIEVIVVMWSWYVSNFLPKWRPHCLLASVELLLISMVQLVCTLTLHASPFVAGSILTLELLKLRVLLLELPHGRR